MTEMLRILEEFIERINRTNWNWDDEANETIDFIENKSKELCKMLEKDKPLTPLERKDALMKHFYGSKDRFEKRPSLLKLNNLMEGAFEWFIWWLSLFKRRWWHK